MASVEEPPAGIEVTPAPVAGTARERTLLAWNRSGLSALICIAVLLRHLWPLNGTGSVVALIVIAVAAFVWATRSSCVHSGRRRQGRERDLDPERIPADDLRDRATGRGRLRAGGGGARVNTWLSGRRRAAGWRAGSARAAGSGRRAGGLGGRARAGRRARADYGAGRLGGAGSGRPARGRRVRRWWGGFGRLGDGGWGGGGTARAVPAACHSPSGPTTYSVLPTTTPCSQSPLVTAMRGRNRPFSVLSI